MKVRVRKDENGWGKAFYIVETRPWYWPVWKEAARFTSGFDASIHAYYMVRGMK